MQSDFFQRFHLLFCFRFDIFVLQQARGFSDCLELRKTLPKTTGLCQLWQAQQIDKFPNYILTKNIKNKVLTIIKKKCRNVLIHENFNNQFKRLCQPQFFFSFRSFQMLKNTKFVKGTLKYCNCYNLVALMRKRLHSLYLNNLIDGKILYQNQLYVYTCVYIYIYIYIQQDNCTNYVSISVLESCRTYTQRYFFEILLNQTEVRFYLPCTD